MSRAGDKAFNRCDVKIVQFTDYVYELSTEVYQNEYIVPKAGASSVKIIEVGNEIADARNHQYAGSQATLHCPRTEDERVAIESVGTNHADRLKALASLRQLAGELICRHCRFSTMTPVEVSEERARLARAEAERTEALAALEMARDELRKASPNALPTLNED